MNDENDDILIEFVQETRDHLAAIEPDLLELERQGEHASAEVINRIFRAIHSTKGGAAFLAFGALKQFSHAMESVLMLVRDGQLTPTSQIIDTLLRGVNVIRVMISEVRRSDQVPCERELHQLEAILAAPNAKPSTLAPPRVARPTAADLLPEPTLRQVAAAGQSLYVVRLHKQQDLATRGRDLDSVVAAVESVGQCFRVAHQADGKDSHCEVVCGSVLETDLLATALGLPAAVICRIDLSAFKSSTPQPAPRAVLEDPPSTHVASRNQQLLPSQASLEPNIDEAPASRVAFESPLVGQESLRNGNERQETLRVRVDLLTRLMNVAGELVLGRNQLLRSLRDSADSIPGLPSILQHVNRVTSELQEGIMQTRMQPVSTLFGRYTRIARDLGRQLGKQIELETSGKDVELDKSIIEVLADPLTHIVRNAIDHGIELPEERQRQGKNPVGNIRIAAFHESGQVCIVVSDDGRGINRDKVRRKAQERHLVTQVEAAALGDREITNLISMPGFSTADNVTDLSGRGVGMDVVRTNVEKLGGHVEIDSVEYHGTNVRLRLPLTLAIIPSLIVRVGEGRYAIPQVNIVELVWIRAGEVRDRVELVQGAPLLRLRGHLLPLVDLAYTLRVRGAPVVHEILSKDEEMELVEASDPRDPNANQQTDLSVVVLRSGELRFGVLVDELYEWEEIVVKPVPSYLIEIGGFAGTTILGDGRVIMILDPGGIAKLAQLDISGRVKDDNRKATEAAQHAQNQSIILFSNAPGELFAVPQDRVLRLERIEPGQLECIGGHYYVKYRNQGLPVIRLESYYPVSSVPDNAEELYLIIPREAGAARTAEPTGGILVWKILDALDIDIELNRPMFTGPGIKGSAIVIDTMTMFMDPAELLAWATAERNVA